LLALLIGHGTARASALTAANRLLSSRGVHGLTRMHLDELAEVPGIGSAVAARITAAIELGRRTLTISPSARPQLLTAHDAAEILLPQFGAYPVERFGVLLLDARHRLLRTRLLSSGSRDASLVHPLRGLPRSRARGRVGDHRVPQSPIRRCDAQRRGSRVDPPARRRRRGNGH
jgi:DNA repair protein RadC